MAEQFMRASVVVPTYNGSHHLPRLLECLRRVRPVRIAEILICDDGSSENIRGVARRYANTLPIVYLRQNRRGFRAGAARNMGIAASTGDVILFVDHDVSFPPALVDAHLRHHEVALRPQLVLGLRHRIAPASAEACRVDLPFSMEDHRREILQRVRYGIAQCSIPWYYAYACNLSVPSVLRSERFDEAFHGWGNEDIDYAYRLWRQGVEIVCASDAMVVHQDECEMRDPYLNESRGQPADFTSLALNTVRMLLKYPDDQLLISTLRDDLRGFSIVGDLCVRNTSADGADSVIRWGMTRIASE